MKNETDSIDKHLIPTKTNKNNNADLKTPRMPVQLKATTKNPISQINKFKFKRQGRAYQQQQFQLSCQPRRTRSS